MLQDSTSPDPSTEERSTSDNRTSPEQDKSSSPEEDKTPASSESKEEGGGVATSKSSSIGERCGVMTLEYCRDLSMKAPSRDPHTYTHTIAVSSCCYALQRCNPALLHKRDMAVRAQSCGWRPSCREETLRWL